MARHIHAFFDEPHNREVIAELLAQGVRYEAEAPIEDPSSLPLTGKTYVLTGSLDGMTRSEAKARLEALGCQGDLQRFEEHHRGYCRSRGRLQAGQGRGAGHRGAR
jgi:hypothetical protein